MKLAEALLRRKELQDRLARMKTVDNKEIYEVRIKRVSVAESTDEVTAAVPKITYATFQAEYNHNARALRLIDAAIQQANWTTDIAVSDMVIQDWTPPETPEK